MAMGSAVGAITSSPATRHAMGPCPEPTLRVLPVASSHTSTSQASSSRAPRDPRALMSPMKRRFPEEAGANVSHGASFIAPLASSMPTTRKASTSSGPRD